MHEFYSGYLHGTNDKHFEQNDLTVGNKKNTENPISQYGVTI